MGRPVAHAPFEIRRGFAERATWLHGAAAGALADTDVGDPTGAHAGFRRFIRHDPLGVVLVVAPWNYPYLCSVNAVVPALLAGNAVVLKVASQTPLVAERWAEGLRRRRAARRRVPVRAHRPRRRGGHGGRPAGRLRRVHRLGGGRPRRAARGVRALRRHGPRARRQGPRLRAGRRRRSRRRSPSWSTASTFNAGQSCCAVERIYVDRRRFDDFVDAFVVAVSGPRARRSARPGHHARPARACRSGRRSCASRWPRRWGRGPGRSSTGERSRPTWSARPTSPPRCWSTSTTACGS